MSHCPANPRFQFIHEERATGSHYVCALCGARSLRAWEPPGANLEIIEQMQDGILRSDRWGGGHPKAVALLGGVVCMVHSAEHESAVRRAERWVWLCALVFAVILPIALYHFS